MQFVDVRNMDSSAVETGQQNGSLLSHASILESLGYPVIVLDAQAHCVFVNSQAERLFDCTSEALLGRSPTSIIPGIADHPFAAAWQQALSEQRAIEIETFYPPSAAWFQMKAKPDVHGGVVIHFVDMTGRVQAEQTLRENEERWHLALRGNHDGIWDWNLQTDEVFFSTRWKAILGYEEHEITSNLKEWSSRVHLQDLPRAMADIQAHLNGKTPFYSNEHRMRHKDGSWVWILDRGMALFDEHGTPYRMVGSHTDITERKRLEEQVHLLSTATRESLTGIVITDAQERILFVNPAVERATGYASEELIGKHPGDVFQGPDTDPETRQRIREALNARQPVTAEILNYQKDGTPLWIEMQIAPIFDATGELTHFVGLQNDITHRKLTESALRESEARFQVFMDSSSVLAWITDESGRMCYVNQPYARLVHLTPAEVIGRHLSEFFPPEQVDTYLQNNRQVRDTGQILEAIETASGMNGKQASYLTYKFPIQSHGNQALVGGMAIDITERQRLEAQLYETQKMDSIGRLAGGIAHDFNNLLAIILGYAEMAEEELPSNSPLRSKLRTIADAADRASGLTRQLLSFARRQMSAPQDISPNHLIENMGEMIRPLMGEAIALETHLEEAVGQVHMDPVQLEQVLVNLLVNARDAMPDGGRLSIRTQEVVFEEDYLHSHVVIPAGHYIHLSVIDTGIGMTEEIQSRIFEPFFTTKEMGRGTGLGLASVYGIVKQNKGYIFVESAVGEGSAFHLYLPKVQATIAPSPETEISAAVPRGKGTILVVEDEPLLRGLSKTTLKKSGYEVLEAGDGVQALQVAAAYEGEIHLLLTDAVMPHMGGRELIERIRQSRPEIRLLLASGYSEDRLLGDGAFPDDMCFLSKPYTPARLLTKVSEALA